MKCLVLLLLKNVKDEIDIMESVTYLETSLRDTFRGAEINTLNIVEDVELIQKTLQFFSNTLKIDFIITVGGFCVGSECTAMEAMRGVTKQPNDTLTLFLDVFLPDTCHRFNHGILHNTLIFNFPGSLEHVTEYYTACKTVLPQLLRLSKELKMTQELLEQNNDEFQSQSKSKVDVGQIQKSLFCVEMEPKAALNIIFGASHDLNHQIEYCSIENILGWVLANDITASNDIALVPISKVNGFAYKVTEDCDGCYVKWPLIELNHDVKECPTKSFVSVVIGETIPPGADCVVKINDCKISDDYIDVCVRVSNNMYNINKIGLGAVKNQNILSKGTLVGPLERGLLTNLKMKVLPVYSKPTVSFISIEEGEEDSLLNSVTTREMLLGFLGELKILPHNLGMIEPDPDQIKAALENAFRRSDIVIVATQKLQSPDKYILEYVLHEDFQTSIYFTGLKMNSNVPTIFATCIIDGKTKYVLALPGNLLLTIVTYKLMVLPLLYWLMGVKHNEIKTKDFISCDNTLHTILSEHIMRTIPDLKWFQDVISSCKSFHDSFV